MPIISVNEMELVEKALDQLIALSTHLDREDQNRAKIAKRIMSTLSIQDDIDKKLIYSCKKGQIEAVVVHNGIEVRGLMSSIIVEPSCSNVIRVKPAEL